MGFDSSRRGLSACLASDPCSVGGIVPTLALGLILPHPTYGKHCIAYSCTSVAHLISSNPLRVCDTASCCCRPYGMYAGGENGAFPECAFPA